MNFDNEKFSPLFDKIPSSRLLLLDFGKFEKEITPISVRILMMLFIKP